MKSCCESTLCTLSSAFDRCDGSTFFVPFRPIPLIIYFVSSLSDALLVFELVFYCEFGLSFNGGLFISDLFCIFCRYWMLK